MMKATELRPQDLRIGNLLFHTITQSIVEVVEIRENIIRIKYKDKYLLVCCDQVEPIPLNEEWLLKFGFELIKKIEIDYIDNYYFRKSLLKNGNINEAIEINIPFNNCEIGDFIEDDFKNRYLLDIDIQHVHQLQNLYFALTGEELTLKQ